MRQTCLAVAVTAIAACHNPQPTVTEPGPQANEARAVNSVAPVRRGPHTAPVFGGGPLSLSPTTNANGIDYHGGSIMRNAKLYLILYGAWGSYLDTNSVWKLFELWIKGLSQSSYWGINTTYYDKSGYHVRDVIGFGGFASDPNYSHGQSLNSSSVEQIVLDTINNNLLPNDPNGVYLVLTDNTVSEGPNDDGNGNQVSFCTDYCGYHNSTAQHLKYGFVGNPDRCPNTCEPFQNQLSSPNGNIAADAMISLMTHELAESVTDPLGDGWWIPATINGKAIPNAENGDLCAWNFGPTTVLPNGSQYNVVLAGHEFLIQQNWLNVNGGGCALGYPHDTLKFSEADNRLVSYTGDWEFGSYKAECSSNGAVTGLSENPSTGVAEAVFCTDQPAATTAFPHQSCSTVDFSAGDNRRTTTTGDWDFGFPKGECDTNEYVAGVAQTPGGEVDALLCCPGNVTHQNCTPHYYYNGDSREDTGSGDWDFGYYKGDCGPGRYVAGVARNTRAGQPGGPDAILCCQ
jgi:hypothetical protein